MKDFFLRGWGLFLLVGLVIFPGLSMPVDFLYESGSLPRFLLRMTDPLIALPWLLIMNYMDWVTTDFLVKRRGPNAEMNIIWRRYFKKYGYDRRAKILKLAVSPIILIVIAFASPGISFAGVVLSSIEVTHNYVLVGVHIRRHGTQPPVCK